jgi:hypothetical protein
MAHLHSPAVAVLLAIPLVGCAIPVPSDSESDPSGDDLPSDLAPTSQPYDSSELPPEPPDPCVVGMKHVAGGHTFIIPVPCHWFEVGDRGDPPPEDVVSPFERLPLPRR